MNAILDHLAKLHRVADGAAARINSWSPATLRQMGDQPAAWWDGYRQAIDDVTEFVKHEKEKPDVIR